jgi:hypothetical protein
MELSKDQLIDKLWALVEKWESRQEYSGIDALSFIEDIKLLLEQIDQEEED